MFFSCRSLCARHRLQYHRRMISKIAILVYAAHTVLSRAADIYLYAKWGDRVKDDSLLPFLFKLCIYFALCVCLTVLNTRRSEMEEKSSKSDFKRICNVLQFHHPFDAPPSWIHVMNSKSHISIYHLIWIKSTLLMLQMHLNRSVDHLNARESTRELSIACGKGTERYQNYFIRVNTQRNTMNSPSLSLPSQHCHETRLRI